uniref:CD36 family protein n=1 Tax=Syphacia muris TaxID=451379 RepID=A0A0N5AEC1_9BILA
MLQIIKARQFYFTYDIIHSSLILSNQLKVGTEFFNHWKNPPYTVKSSIYAYSVDNPDQILNGSKPQVTPFGPYVYDIKMWNEVLSMRNGIVKYQTYTKYYLNTSESCPGCFPDNKIWIPNIVYQKFVEAASTPSLKATQTALVTQKPFLEVSVDDVLFKGYKDPFLDKICSLPLMNFLCDSILDLPERIAFLEEKNSTHRGTIEASTGEADTNLPLGTVISWNGKSTLPRTWWSDHYATMINGTDSLFQPYLKKSDRLYVFVPDLCRSLYFVFDKEIDYKGVPTYRYKVPEEVFKFTSSENKGFCYNSGKSFFSANEKCLPDGLLDISRCQKGSEPPVVFSLPNFLFADQRVKDSIIGLNESSLEHDGILLDIEPRTAAILRILRRSQINIALWKGNGIAFGLINLLFLITCLLCMYLSAVFVITIAAISLGVVCLSLALLLLIMKVTLYFIKCFINTFQLKKHLILLFLLEQTVSGLGLRISRIVTIYF